MCTKGIHEYNRRKRSPGLRFWLAGICIVCFMLLSILGACTQMDGFVPGPGKKPVTDGQSYTVRFAPLRIEEGTATRAAQIVASGRLRLLVYPAGASITTDQPAGQKLYDVTDGQMTVVSGDSDLELSAGNYHFYALMPGESVLPVLGVTLVAFTHGQDIHASMTKVSVSEGAVVTLTPLAHKASRLEFVIEKAADATYQALGQPSQMVLYSQPHGPVAFKLDDTGGNFRTVAGLDTLRFDAFAPQSAPETGYRQDRVVLPRPVGDFNIAIDTQIDLGDGKGMTNCTVKGQIENRMFDPGKYYHFRIRVRDLREGGDIMLVVTDWNRFGWDGSMGGSGQEILAGQWTGITYGDDMGV